ncbi:hypothetical protein B5F78_03315 [Bacteroides sp. An279]|nr:hypothetical protein B5F78_03315 [Bacteroides sp. An279]
MPLLTALFSFLCIFAPVQHLLPRDVLFQTSILLGVLRLRNKVLIGKKMKEEETGEMLELFCGMRVTSSFSIRYKNLKD